jgi:hypothetical protein
MLYICLVFISPFLLNYRLVFTFQDKFLPIGNDFSYLYYVYKPYLLSFIANGKIPLWMPQEAAGFDFALNPFTQSFYPLNLFLQYFSFVDQTWGVIDQQRFTVLGVSIFSVAFFLIIHKFQNNLLISTLTTIIMASSYKLIEILRFPNAVHAIACISWIICSAIYLVRADKTRTRVLWLSLLILSSLSLIFSGYPYFLAYFIITMPGFFIFLLCFYRIRYPESWKPFISFLALVLTGIVVTLILTFPYLQGMINLLNSTNDRSGGNWDYSTEHRFSFVDYLGSIILPNRASFEGWFYFGTIGIITISVAVFIKIKEKRRSLRDNLLVIGCLTWVLNIVFFGLSKDNPLFTFIWSNVPPIQTLRVWGRINILLLFPIGIIISLALQKIYLAFFKKNNSYNFIKFLRYCFVASFILLITQLILVYLTKVDSDLRNYLIPSGNVPRTREFIFETLMLLFFLIIFTVSTYRRNLINPKKTSAPRYYTRSFVLLFAVFWILQTHGFRFDGWMWTSSNETSLTEINPQLYMVNSDHLEKVVQSSILMGRRTLNENASFSFLPPWGTQTIPNWHYREYSLFLNNNSISPVVKDHLLGVTSSSRFFVVNSKKLVKPEFLMPRDFVIPTLVDYNYSGDYFSGKFITQESGVLVFADNWAPGWTASIDGTPVETSKILGTFKGINISSGVSQVEFKYCPFQNNYYRIFCPDEERN